jgi:hypothetical protein
MRSRPPTPTEIERHISDLALAFGWHHHHARYAGRTRDGYADGFPSDVLLRGGRLVLITVAGTNGVLSDPELGWAEALSATPTVEMLIVDRGDLKPLTNALRAPGGQSGAIPVRAGSRGPPAA